MFGFGKKKAPPGFEVNLKPGHNNHFPLLQKNLQSGPYQMAACGENAPTIAEIKEFEREAGVKLPDDFISFSVSKIGGFVVEVKEEFWPPAKEFDVRPAWAFRSGLSVFGFAQDIPEWMDIRLQTSEFRDATQSRLVPCLKVMGDADRYCFDPAGKVLWWDHETGETKDVKKTFLQVLDQELGELSKRQIKMLEERDKFLPKE